MYNVSENGKPCVYIYIHPELNMYKYMYTYMYTQICIYECECIIPSGPQVSPRGGVGWGMLTSCSWYVDGWGGVGWGMLTSCSWYVDGWGGVGHVNVMFMVR